MTMHQGQPLVAFIQTLPVYDQLCMTKLCKWSVATHILVAHISSWAHGKCEVMLAASIGLKLTSVSMCQSWPCLRDPKLKHLLCMRSCRVTIFWNKAMLFVPAESAASLPLYACIRRAVMTATGWQARCLSGQPWLASSMEPDLD